MSRIRRESSHYNPGHILFYFRGISRFGICPDYLTYSTNKRIIFRGGLDPNAHCVSFPVLPFPNGETRLHAGCELAVAHSKIDHCGLNSHPFDAAFSGIERVWQTAEGGIFFTFSFEHICVHTFWITQWRGTYVR